MSTAMSIVIAELHSCICTQTTQAHPRVGVFVATVVKGIDDIVHFIHSSLSLSPLPTRARGPLGERDLSLPRFKLE